MSSTFPPSFPIPPTVSASTSDLDRFKKYEPPMKATVRMSLQGPPKGGKTHWVLSAPGPIVYINHDDGLDRVRPHQKYPELDLRDVKVPLLDKYGDVDKIQAEADRVWRWLKSELIAATKVAKTVVIDTFTETWELGRLAHFGKLSNVRGHNYGPINAEFQAILRRFKEADINLLLIHKEKDEYRDDKRTGNLERAGFSSLEYFVDDYIRCFWDPADRKFKYLVLDSGSNPALKGLVFESDPTTAFVQLAMQLHPGTFPPDWMSE